MTDEQVDDGLPPRTREVWMSVKLLVRLQKEMSEREVDVVFRCRHCGEMLGWVDGAGGPEAVCDCKVREIR